MAEIKRPNYFTSEFLVDKDFIDEQTYHRDMRYRHNQLLHTWGVVDGLTVSKTGDKQVTVSPGMAINKDGKEIILPSDPSPQPINLSGTGDVYVTIEYQDVKDEADKDTTSGVINEYRRITERPLLKSTTSQPTNDGAVILLAKVNLSNNGNINTLDHSVRIFASAKIAPRAVTIDQLADNSVNAAKIVDGAVGTAELANGSVTVDKLADNSVNAAKITDGAVGTTELANGSVTVDKLADNSVNAAKITDGAVGTTELANGSVTVDKLADNSVNAAKIVDGAVGTAELANGSVTVDKLADNSVNAAKIVDGAVGTAELANDSVNESKLTSSVRGKFNDLQQSQWRHNRNLHTFGVAGDGLVVRFANDKANDQGYEVWNPAMTSVDLTVSPGMAIDFNGREILLSSAVTYTLSVPQVQNGFSTFLILQADSGSQQGIIAQNTNPPQDGSVIILMRIYLERQVFQLDSSPRQVASAQVRKARQKVSIRVDSAQEQPCLETTSARVLDEFDQSYAPSLGINNNSFASAPQRAESTGINNRSSASALQQGAGAFSIGIDNSSSASGKTSASSYGVRVFSSASSSDANASTYSYGLWVQSSVSSAQTNPNAYSYGVYASASGGTNARAFGVYTTARGSITDSYSLYVEGRARITGGTSTGHITDRFINRSGQRLRTGDVVKLKGTPIARFSGENNKIPIAEVTLADRENDTKVIGIVDSESIPGPDTPDTRVGADDPTFVEDGSELDVVILGAYAHCKVDATETPIEVGDLLTSSNNPGHAKKATDPKIGSIIGKALEPLATGTGYIAVFVNIQ
jgi:hypothetical protein